MKTISVHYYFSVFDFGCLQTQLIFDEFLTFIHVIIMILEYSMRILCFFSIV